MKELDRLILNLLIICAQQPHYDLEFIISKKDDQSLWKLALELLKLNKIESVVYNNLKKNDLSEYIPNFVLERLIKKNYHCKIKNNELKKRLEEILKSFSEKNIDVVLLKGMDIAYNYYSDHSDRTIGDIDILVSSEVKNESIEILTNLGFFEDQNLQKKPEVYNAIDSKNIYVDLHFGLKFFEKHNLNQIADRQRNNVYCLKPELLLAYLVEHQFVHLEHDGFYLRFLIDLIKIYGKPEVVINLDNVKEFLSENCKTQILERSILFIKQIAPELNVGLDTNSKIKPYTISIFRRSRVTGFLGLRVRKAAWARLLLAWLGIVKKKLKLTPSPVEIVKYLLD